MDVPVIPAAGFKGDIRQSATQRDQPALSVKILCIGIVGLSDGKLDRFLVVGFGIVFGPDIFREPECSPGFGPSGIKGCMRNEFCDFSSCDTVVFRVLQMMDKGSVCQSLGHQSRYGDHGTLFQGQFVCSVPDLPKKNAIIQMCEFRCKFSKLLPPGCLSDCHAVPTSVYWYFIDIVSAYFGFEKYRFCTL